MIGEIRGRRFGDARTGDTFRATDDLPAPRDSISRSAPENRYNYDRYEHGREVVEKCRWRARPFVCLVSFATPPSALKKNSIALAVLLLIACSTSRSCCVSLNKG